MAAAVESFKFSTPNGGSITCDYSTFSLENCRFSPDGLHARMHPNEDRVAVTPVHHQHVGEEQSEKPQSVLFTVLDGHDGNLAVEYFETHLPKCLSERLATGPFSQDHTKIVMDAILQVDQEFFDALRSQIHKRREITGLLEVCGLLCWRTVV